MQSSGLINVMGTPGKTTIINYSTEFKSDRTHTNDAESSARLRVNQANIKNVKKIVLVDFKMMRKIVINTL